MADSGRSRCRESSLRQGGAVTPLLVKEAQVVCGHSVTLVVFLIKEQSVEIKEALYVRVSFILGLETVVVSVVVDICS